MIPCMRLIVAKVEQRLVASTGVQFFGEGIKLTLPYAPSIQHNQHLVQHKILLSLLMLSHNSLSVFSTKTVPSNMYTSTYTTHYD